MARYTFVKAARNDIPSIGVKRGESYYWWEFRFGGRHYSKTQPKRSQLTQSAFYSTLYDIQDQMSDAPCDEGLESFVEDIISELESLRDDCQSNFDNIPKSLQSGSSGELLEERVRELEDRIDQLQSLDFSTPPENYEEPERNEDESDEDYNVRENNARAEYDSEVEAYWENLKNKLEAIDLDIS